MIDFSKKRLGRARDEKLEPRQLAVAELMAWGWDAVDAMLAVGLIRETDTKIDAQHAAVNFTANEDFTAIHKKRVKQLRNGCVLDEYQKLHPTPGTPGSAKGRPRSDGNTSRKVWEGPVDEPVADEEILAKMWETITQLEPKDPKRVDLLDKYDKLKRRQGVGEDDTTIHFYLPRPECDTCPFRGNHVITEPEAMAMAGIEPEEEEEHQNPGWSPSGRKIGAPPKKRRKRKQKPPSIPTRLLQLMEAGTKYDYYSLVLMLTAEGVKEESAKKAVQTNMKRGRITKSPEDGKYFLSETLDEPKEQV